MNSSNLPPANVQRALLMLWVALGISTASGLLHLLDPPMSELPLAMVRLIGITTTLVVLALEIFLLVMIRRAHNAARIIYLVLFLLGLPMWLSGLLASDWSGLAGVLKLISIAVLLMRCLALWWLFTGSSVVWFQRATVPAADKPASAVAVNAASPASPIRSPVAAARTTPPAVVAAPAPSPSPAAPVSPAVPATDTTSGAVGADSSPWASMQPGQSVLEAFSAGRQIGLRATPAASPSVSASGAVNAAGGASYGQFPASNPGTNAGVLAPTPAAAPGSATSAEPVAAIQTASPPVADPTATAVTCAGATTSVTGAHPLAELRRRFEAAANAVRIWTWLFALTAAFELLLIILFVNKVRQTSEWALRYSPVTHQEVGQWSIMIVIVGLIAFVLMIVAVVTRGTRSQERQRYAAALQQQLATARASNDVPQQVHCESELRRLGA